MSVASLPAPPGDLEFGESVASVARMGEAACASRRRSRTALMLVVVTGALAVMTVGAGVSLAGPDRTAGASKSVRLLLSVRSSVAATQSLVRGGRRSSSSAGDPWRRFLASDKQCPNGDRMDLSLRRRTETAACLVNFARRKYGLRPLPIARVLTAASSRKARSILRCRRFEHNPCGGDWTTPIRSTGYRGGIAENLYLSTPELAAPRQAVDAWLNSPPHRENLFGATWRAQGIALVVVPRFEGSGRVIVWVNVLGDHRS
jgi:uncharacterized protein YkwD